MLSYTAPKHLTFYEFFAGGGMARAGLGKHWTCLFANDFDEMKAATYADNWNDQPLCTDIASVRASDLPGIADLAWASFPCQDLSLAGDRRGIGHHSDKVLTRSGTFWPFWQLIRGLADEGRAPKTIMLENVCGTITSGGGKGFQAIVTAVADANYRVGAMVVDAKWFVPQSRPRLFVFGVRRDLDIPPAVVAGGPSEKWHPRSILSAYCGLSAAARDRWVWWCLPEPRKRIKTFSDLIEETPTNVEWDSPEETRRLLSMMSDINRDKVREAKKAGRRVVGGVYKRTRAHNDTKMQRAEVRFDDVAGCLRTPRGGSSRQRILVVEGEKVRSRLLSPREAARLMGLPDSYSLPARYNDAYHVAGDGVVVSVVRHLARNLITPVLDSQDMVLQAAE